MHYAAAILGGVAASAAFWLVDKYLLGLSPSYQWVGAIACFVVFGVLGFWLASKTPSSAVPKAGTRIASGLKGKGVKVAVDGVTATGSGSTDVVTDIDAKGDIDAKVKNIETKP